MNCTLLRYSSIDESGDDTAYGVYQREDNSHYLVGIGPGYKPEDRSNKCDQVYGSCVELTSGEAGELRNVDCITDSILCEEVNPGEWLNVNTFDNWADHVAVQKIMVDLLSGNIDRDGDMNYDVLAFATLML